MTGNGSPGAKISFISQLPRSIVESKVQKGAGNVMGRNSRSLEEADGHA